jgi:polyisoprenoid-binding protein YceI
MTSKLIKFCLIALIAFLSLPALSAEKPQAKQILKIDLEKSVVHWIGYKIGGYHDGFLKVSSGAFEINPKGEVDAGIVTIDMTSLSDIDLKDAGMKTKLVEHLKSADFFDVEKFPTANFRLTSGKRKADSPEDAAEYTLDGTITIKGISKPVNVPITLVKKAGALEGQAKIQLDRTVFGLKYGSGKFFQNLGDKLIKDEFTVELRLPLIK